MGRWGGIRCLFDPKGSHRVIAIVGLAVLFVAVLGAPADAQSSPPPFEIETINGESADQVNQVEFHDDAPLTIELDGVDVSEYRFNVTIGGYDYWLFPDDDGVLEARRENPSEGQYTLTMTIIHRGEEATSAETEIEITDAGDQPDRDRDRDDPVEPSEFEIATINGESADQVNEIEFHDDAPIEIELDGVDISEHRFTVTIGEYEYRLSSDDVGVLETRRENPSEGQYTLTVTIIHRGEEATSAETEIEIIDAGDPRDRGDPGVPDGDDEGDRDTSADGRDDGSEDTGPVDGDVDDVHGFGIAVTIAALILSLCIASRRR